MVYFCVVNGRRGVLHSKIKRLIIIINIIKRRKAMKHRTLKTMLAAVLILCTLLPLPAANAKTKYTVEVKKTEVEADVAFNTNGYASLTKKIPTF